MNVIKKILPKSIVELEISVPYADMGIDLDRAAAELSKEFEVAGFRPGKAPRTVVEKTVGVTKLLEAAARHTISRTLPEAAEQQDVRETVGRPEVILEQLAPEKEIKYRARIAVLPPVSVEGIESIKVERKKISIAPEKSEKVLHDLRKMRAREVAVDREAQAGDKVLLDMNIKIAGVPVEGGQQQGMMLWVGEDKMIPGFEEKIVGATIGQQLTFELPFPDGYHVKHLAGKTGEFEIIIKNIFAVSLPEIDDAFAQGVGNFKTLSELKQQLDKNLLEEATQEENHRIEKELLEKLAERTTVRDIPDALIESELVRMHDELQQSLAERGVSYETWLEHLKKTADEVKGDLRPQAESRIKTMLAIRQLARDKDITIEESEIDQEINEILAQYSGQRDIESRIRHVDYREVLRGRLLNRKILTWMTQQCVVEKE